MNPAVVVKRADELDARVDAVLCMPWIRGAPSSGVRIPVRSSWVEGGYLQYEAGSRSVVSGRSAGRLGHLVLSFPEGCFCHGVRCFEGGSSLGLSFTLYEPRQWAGPSAAAVRELERLDALSDFLTATSLGCDALRRVAGLSADTPAEPTMSIVRRRPVVIVDNGEEPPQLHPEGGVAAARYFCTKITLAGGPPVRPATVFLTPGGAVVPLERVREWRNFRVAPYVDVEEIFVSGGRRSLQLRLRECIVHPPDVGVAPAVVGGAEGTVAPAPPPPPTRQSVAFPDRLCGHVGAVKEAQSVTVVALPTDEEKVEEEEETAAAAAKRPRHN